MNQEDGIRKLYISKKKNWSDFCCVKKAKFSPLILKGKIKMSF